MKYLVLGATGMAGHIISIYLAESGHDVTAFSRRPFKYCRNIMGDATDLRLIEQIIHDGKFDAVINCIGLLNQKAEEDKHTAVFLNSFLPHYLTHITKTTRTKVIHMSTDCVFSGKSGNYTENSLRDGETFYDRSKALGEIDNSKDLTFRCSIVGPDINENGIGLFNWFMRQTDSVCGYTKAIWTGVTTLTLAKAICEAEKCNLSGLYNLVNNTMISKYELLKLFNKYFRDNSITIDISDRVNLNKSLINNRTDFHFDVPSYDLMVAEMKIWMDRHKALYPHYKSRSGNNG